ncbi:stationary phase inducible protein CsiE [Citrobacter rodentium]|uniref:Stationary phase inducible protein n=2 Tax=Citrobacter rodentium TaxID=67825 RepID=D2TTZ8_CITRI|nr:stationary phase inducible protein CsiE [Citrobacter rodentium]KIQ48584.1 stationary phase inducible protein CsiE [Citrobacter rodentium]QBY28984.1 stationary phase inducible protein CsiE [Citrobacter rodentium]UHO29157.1 stationary phase inducible protein CsiE [Citrobacter rodentium NBRC 105723 = DSM 16636]CBG89230.1 stationary phase inducible protein [Citrobacter rodentium ICC168]HAT8011745.1 stationary phase inducible protein CsiE [Citrobacter rodentium NBRC 105723 = DSM 16636]
MMSTLAPPSVLSAPQRRCQILLTLFQPGQIATAETFSALNGVDETLAREDITETEREIQRYHRLNIISAPDGCYRIEGTALNQRLCLLHWLRRGLRLCPNFISRHFTPALKGELKQRGILRTLYDDTNLHALINLCARRLQRAFESRDVHFLRLYLQYCLLQHHAGISPEFNPIQQRWVQACAEYQLAEEIGRHWQRRVRQDAPLTESLFMALLFSMVRLPDPVRDNHQQNQQLRLAIARLVLRFREAGAVKFNDEQGLNDQLYIHLAQALNRSLFSIGIDNTLPDEFARLYPRLMRTTRDALRGFEEEYNVAFSEEEMGLVAVIFGAWLMQDNDLHEKQIVLLTGDNQQLEQQIEQQLRELTLLPLNIKPLPMQAFQQEGTPRGVALIVTPYTTPLPLFSPPLIHAEQALTTHQQQQIRKMLESG